MVLDSTGAELLVLVGIASLVLGKKELPVLARMAGRGTGKLVALLNSARDQITKATENTPLSKIHEEVRQDMYELSHIRSEIRAAGVRPQFRGSASLRSYQPSSPVSATNRVSGQVPPLSSATPSWLPEPASAGSEGRGSSAVADEAVSAPTSSPRLGQLAMAEILMQERELEAGGPSVASSPRAPSARPDPSELTGSDVVDQVIMETIMRDHIDRFSGKNKSPQKS